MVKRGGTKRKIPMEKIMKKESLATAFTKRSYGLFSKASQLCLLSGGQIAVLASPPSSHSNVSFYSFGHSSVDSLVSAFLAGKRPVPVEETRDEDIGVILARKDLGLGLWWEDEVLAKSDNPQDLTDAMNSMSSLLTKFKELRSGDADGLGSNPNSDQTLIFQSDNEKSEPDQTLIPQSDSPICRIPDDDLPESFNEITEEQSQILAICESFCDTEENNDKALTGSLDVGYDQEMDINQFIDFDTDFDTSVFDDCLLESTDQEETTASLLINANPNPISVYQGLEEEGLVLQNRAFDQDSLRFSGFFNTTAAV